MRIACHSFFYLAIACGVLTAQTLQQDFKFPENNKPGDTLKITGTDQKKVKSMELRAEGKTPVSVDLKNASATDVSFTIPPDATGKYQVVLGPGSIPPIPLNVDKQTPNQGQAGQMPPAQSP